jgi:hypothetical protein
MSTKEFHGNGAFFYPPITVYENETEKKLGKLKEWKKRKIIFISTAIDVGDFCHIIITF